MSTSPARTLKGSRRLQRRRDRRSPSPQWQFLRGFFKNPVMVGSIIPSSKVLIEKMLGPVDWENTKLFVEYGPGVGTFTRPVLEQLAPDALIHLVQAYRTLGYKEDVQETCGYIRRFHPRVPGLAKSCPVSPAAS